MSRSVRHTPRIGFCADSDQAFKRIEHGRARVATRAALADGNSEACPHPKRYGDPWNAPKDGKMWLGKDRDTRRWLRK